jgi:2-dehydro-3-deoxyphosphogluconate aldolase/(4S)-4-hydroxy-2-oxoglutarate aldolase
MLDKYPDMIVGAGTVLTIQQVEKALNAGAKFIVSPGYDEEIVSYCVEKGVAVFPGCVTPTEILKALKHGLNVIKFFPAEQYGGLATINALAGPFGGVKFMPTGGISLSNLADFASNKNIAACGGSFMVADKYINDKNWAEITKICAEAIEIIRKARG